MIQIRIKVANQKQTTTKKKRFNKKVELKIAKLKNKNRKTLLLAAMAKHLYHIRYEN